MGGRLEKKGGLAPIMKQTQNIANEPSNDFFPSRPSLSDTVSPPNETPMIAALMSPKTRNRIDAIAIEGGEIAMESVQPSEK